MAIIIAVVDGTFVPADRKIDAGQCGVVLEQAVAQLGDGICQLNRFKGGTGGKGIAIQEIHTLFHGDPGQCRSIVERIALHSPHTCREVDVSQRRAVPETIVADRLQFFRQTDRGDAGTALEGRIADGHQRAGQGHIFQIGTSLESVGRKRDHALGNHDGGQAGTAFKHMTVIITVVNGTLVPAQRNIDLHQCRIIQEQAIAQSFHTIGNHQTA